jgi:hypothetical protein
VFLLLYSGYDLGYNIGQFAVISDQFSACGSLFEMSLPSLTETR